MLLGTHFIYHVLEHYDGTIKHVYVNVLTTETNAALERAARPTHVCDT